MKKFNWLKVLKVRESETESPVLLRVFFIIQQEKSCGQEACASVGGRGEVGLVLLLEQTPASEYQSTPTMLVLAFLT